MALFFQRQQTHLLGMYLHALRHTKMPLEMVSLRHQGLSAEESSSSSLPLNLNNDSRVIKCSLSFSAHCYFPPRAAWLRDIFSLSSHKPNSYLLCSATGGKKPLCCPDPAGQLWLGSHGKESSRPRSFSARKKGWRKQGKAMQTQPHPERFVLQLQRNCSPEVPHQGFSDFFLSHILRSALWGASKAQNWLCNLEVIWHFKGLQDSQFVTSAFPWGLRGEMEINTSEQKLSSNLYHKTEHHILNFRFYY